MDVVMPQMGESVTEGTIVRWMKKVGDKVDRDEPLFEISTDKVDAEIPSPAAGILSEIKANEGDTVPVDSVVAIIRSATEVAAPPKTMCARSWSAAPRQRHRRQHRRRHRRQPRSTMRLATASRRCRSCGR